MRLLKEPFVQFLLLGGLIFLAYSLSQSAEDAGAERRIVVDAATQTWLYDNFVKQFGRPPARGEMNALITGHIEEEVKYREAVAMGLDQQDSIVRRRMSQKFDFLFGGAAADAEPEEDTLRAWYDNRIPDYTLPPRVSLEHRWFSPDRRGAEAESDAAAAVEALQAGEPVSGDRFPVSRPVASATPADLRQLFGPSFTETAFELPLNTWHGPVQSGLGFHAVRVTARSEAETVPFAEIRESVLADWREAESRRVLSEMLDTLKAEYAIEIDEAALAQFEYASGGALE